MFRDLNVNSFPRGYGHSVVSKTSFMVSRTNFILTLNISLNNFCKLRSWILKGQSCKKFIVELWSWYTILKALPWTWFIWLFDFPLWNIQKTGAWENGDVIKALRRSFLCSSFKEYEILAKAFSFWLAFLRRDLTWGSDISLWSVWMPRRFSHLL